MTERLYENRFAGWCTNCRGRVLEGQGVCGRLANGKWFVRHNGECPARAEAATPAAPKPPKANQYGGKCANCGVYVPERAGRILKTVNGWKAAHLTPEACEAAKAENAAQPAKAPARTFNVPSGFYAVPSRKAGQDLDFFVVKAYDSGKWAGWTFATEIIGGRERVRINRAAQDVALDAIEASGVEVAGKLYADKIGCCYKCNRLLTDEESRERGIGPDCYRKYVKPYQLAA